MCGIVGYVGDKPCIPILVEGLKKLEYRGYDSAGIATVEPDGIFLEKAKGRLANLENKIKNDNKELCGTVGIGHTRWATHGEPSDVNSHPHRSDKLVLVHNGIIENYSELKARMESKGVKFISQTDTEVVAHLINYYYSGDPVEAIRKATAKIRGSYALGIIFDDFKDTVYAIRKDSPLIVGVGESENFIASDIPAILNRTKNYYLMDENEIAVLKKDSVLFLDEFNEKIKKEMLTATWDVEAAEKGGYAHFMLKEIHEQPKAIQNTVSPRLANGIDYLLSDELRDIDIKRIKIVACGSAMHAGLLGKHAIEKYARIETEVEIASEFRYKNPIFKQGDLVVLISQSGETADSIAALRLAKNAKIPTLAIVNVVGSTISREADRVIYTWAGPEIAVATTKAYSAQVSVMYLLALALAYKNECLCKDECDKIIEQFEKLPDAIKTILKREDEFKRIAAYLQTAENLFFIGRGQDYALCTEGSLKLKEISYVHSEAYAAGELKHGTISLVTDNTPVVGVATDKVLIEKTISNIKEVKARGAKVLFVCVKGMTDNFEFADLVVEIPDINELLIPLLAVIPLQLIAYYTAVLKGCDVDKPRNLAKSVTVE